MTVALKTSSPACRRRGHHRYEVQAYKVACTVDKDKRAVCLTTHKERAEFKRDQILAFGRDPMMASSVGSMSSIIEPAEFDGDDNKDQA